MSTTLELKIRIRELEARVSEQEKLLKKLSDSLESTAVPYIPHPPYVVEESWVPKEKAEIDFKTEEFKVDFTVPTGIIEAPAQKTAHKLCPKCGVKPGYFFHVRSCKG
jgi:hypothetical protein